MKSDIRSRLYLGFAAAVVLVLVVGAISLKTFEKQTAQASELKHAYKVLDKLKDVQNTLANMEASRRGFRSSNKKEFLEPYHNGLLTIHSSLDELQHLTKHDSLQHLKAIALTSGANTLLDFWRDLGEDASQYNQDIVTGINFREKVKMDNLMTAFQEMQDVETKVLTRLEEENKESINTAKWELLSGIALIFCIVMMLIFIILRELKIRSQLLLQMQHQNKSLEQHREDLSETNEELTMQTEALKASEDELKVQEEEMRQLNVALREKNQLVELAREALLIKAQELETASQYKSEFLANMSHELRTPLNSILILAKLLSDNKQRNLTEKQVAHAKIIHKSGADLLQLINDILDLSKIEAGKAELYVEDVSVKTIANDLDQLFAAMAEERQIQYNITVSPEVPERIRTDRQKLEQVLRNLLSNAFKFTHTGGMVDLKFQPLMQGNVQHIAISVKDNGIGIPQSKQEIIFEAFKQAEGSTTRKYGGTGLGLSISTELIKILQGKLELKSDEGKGSEFILSIPRAIDEAGVPAKAEIKSIATEEPQVQQTIVSDDRHLLDEDDKVVLIIEDDERFASLIKEFAQTHGYKAIVALTGDEGLHCAKEYKPSAIILDMLLPGINGETLLKIFSTNPALKHIPVHVISGAENTRQLATSALAFLKKPVQNEDLDKAFTLISEYLDASVKRVMILSPDNLKEKIQARLVEQNHYDVTLDTVKTAGEATQRLQTNKYDCLIADIGKDIEAGIEQLTALNASLEPLHIPTIIYLDNEITAAHEAALKKISNTVVKKSSYSYRRLLDELEIFLYKVREHNTKPQQLTAHSPGKILHNKTVLLVDDDMRNIFAISAMLEQEKMKVLTAYDGKEALSVLRANGKVDIVLMDIMMPEMDGYDAMKAIREELQLDALPVIALTAKAMTGDREKCILSGASDYISKPVDMEKLTTLMKAWLSDN